MCKTDFIDAIEKGDSDQIDSLLASDPSLAAERDDNGVSLVLLALYHGKSELAEAIASHKDSLDLFEACALGRDSRVIELLDEDANAVHSFTPDGFPLLGFATFFGRTAGSTPHRPRRRRQRRGEQSDESAPAAQWGGFSRS